MGPDSIESGVVPYEVAFVESAVASMGPDSIESGVGSASVLRAGCRGSFNGAGLDRVRSLVALHRAPAVVVASMGPDSIESGVSAYTRNTLRDMDASMGPDSIESGVRQPVH